MSLRVVMSFFGVVCTLVGVSLLDTAAAAAEVQQTFYVSPSGSDDNPGSEAKPFASIEKARDTIHQTNSDMTGDIVVILHDGIHRIDQKIVWDARDSGMNGHNVIYKARNGEFPIISGGRRITGWQADVDGRWKAATKIDNFRQLYVNGRRAVRARGAAPTNIKLHGKDGYKTPYIQIATWRNPTDIEFCYEVVWCHTRCKVESIKLQEGIAIIRMLQPHFTHARTKEGKRAELPSYIENALELLDEPGEWYLDRATDTVYYQPLAGEDMQQTEVIVPVVEKLVELRGTLDDPVHNIQFEGITFADAGWLLPSQFGLVDVQANFVVDGKKLMLRPSRNSEYLATVHNEHIKSPANIICHAAHGIRFERCTFTRLGGAGIDIEYGSQDNVISGCHFYDISGTAIQVGDVLQNDHHPSDERMIVKNNSVTNNYIHDIGVDYMGAVGIFVGYTEATTIAHNEITRLPYSGISVGWGWGEEDAGGSLSYYQPYRYATPTPAKDNLVEYNHIHGVTLGLDDGGGIYTLGNMPGTMIRGNRIHDNSGFPGGIYLDEGSGFIEITGNVVYDIKKPMKYNNKSQGRIDTCNEHDNFFRKKLDDEKPKAIQEAIDYAGLMPDYRDLLER